MADDGRENGDSLFIWIGKTEDFSDLSVAMCTKYEKTPAVVKLIGDSSEITSPTLAQKIARKSTKQCFVSYNLPPDNTMLEFTEKRLFEEMNKNPGEF